jgi:hypothetical protein
MATAGFAWDNSRVEQQLRVLKIRGMHKQEGDNTPRRLVSSRAFSKSQLSVTVEYACQALLGGTDLTTVPAIKKWS